MLTGSGAPHASEPAAAKATLAEVSTDFNGDGVMDRATLLHDQDGDNTSDVDLAIYLSACGNLPDKPTLYKAAFGWTDDMAGAQPSLKVSKGGSLIAMFQNDGMGRDRWRMQYTIAWRGGELVVAGYSYEQRDTLSPDAGGNCDIDLLSGKGTRNGKPVKVLAGSVPLASWTDASVPGACTF